MTDNYSVVTTTAAVAVGSNYLPVVIADNQEAGAEPNPDPQLHVDPIVAGGRIRQLAREIATKLQHGSASSAHANLFQNATYGVRQARKHLDTAQLIDQRIDGHLEDLRLAIAARKSAEGRVQLKHLTHTLNLEREKRRTVSLYCNEAWEYENLGVFQPGKSNADVMEKIEELLRLTQSLPTITNAPLTHPENTLRAIATILKNNGYFEKTAKFTMHPKPTSEQPPYNHDEEDDQSEYEDPDEDEV